MSVNEYNTVDSDRMIEASNSVKNPVDTETTVSYPDNTYSESAVSEEIKTLNQAKETIISVKVKPLPSASLLSVGIKESDHKKTNEILNVKADMNNEVIVSKKPKESKASMSTNKGNLQPNEEYRKESYLVSNMTHQHMPSQPFQSNTASYKTPTHQHDKIYLRSNLKTNSIHETMASVKTNITFAGTVLTKLKTEAPLVCENGYKQTDMSTLKLKEELSEQTLYVRAAKKLSSLGPLSINNLNVFLENSKMDFEHFYYKKPMSNLQKSDFNFTKTLGVGAFGKVVLSELKRDGTLYAVKIIDKVGVVKRNHTRYVSNEKRILQALNFPFVINLKYFFTDAYHLYFVMPFVPGGNFHKHLKNCRNIKESDAKFYIGQLVLALEYLHYLELIHRDLKTENIMIDALGYLKLVDFGQCIRCNNNDKTWTFTGTPEYMAPEIFVGKGYDCAVDWWALGIITYELCAGFRPFKHENPRKLQVLILCNQYSLPSGFSRALKKLIESLLLLDPKKRIANRTKKASVIKKHVWFSGLNWLALLNRTLEAPYLPNLQKPSL